MHQRIDYLLKFVGILILMLAVDQTCFSQSQVDDTTHAIPASMVTLLAQPAIKNPESVQVAGFLVLDFEGEALYLHREDYQAGLTRNAIRLALSKEQEKEYKDFAGNYVWVEASFLKRKNSDDIFTGSLFNVRQIRKTLARK